MGRKPEGDPEVLFLKPVLLYFSSVTTASAVEWLNHAAFSSCHVYEEIRSDIAAKFGLFYTVSIETESSLLIFPHHCLLFFQGSFHLRASAGCRSPQHHSMAEICRDGDEKPSGEPCPKHLGQSHNHPPTCQPVLVWMKSMFAAYIRKYRKVNTWIYVLKYADVCVFLAYYCLMTWSSRYLPPTLFTFDCFSC